MEEARAACGFGANRHLLVDSRPALTMEGVRSECAGDVLVAFGINRCVRRTGSRRLR